VFFSQRWDCRSSCFIRSGVAQHGSAAAQHVQGMAPHGELVASLLAVRWYTHRVAGVLRTLALCSSHTCVGPAGLTSRARVQHEQQHGS
jgi:hypothetical protein